MSRPQTTGQCKFTANLRGLLGDRLVIWFPETYRGMAIAIFTLGITRLEEDSEAATKPYNSSDRKLGSYLLEQPREKDGISGD